MFEKIFSLEDKIAPFIGNLVIKHMKRCYCANENTENSNLKGTGYLLMNSDEQVMRRMKNIRIPSTSHNMDNSIPEAVQRNGSAQTAGN